VVNFERGSGLETVRLNSLPVDSEEQLMMRIMMQSSWEAGFLVMSPVERRNTLRK
jgi:hypothetical protein